MFHFSCPSCHANFSSDAGDATLDRCERCDTPLRTVPPDAVSVATGARGGGLHLVARLSLTPEFRARYHLGRLLGAGGNGCVFLGTDVGRRRPVALKFFTRPENDAARARFAREGALLRGLEHPGIAQLIDAGELDGHPYLVMEYVPGGNLRARLDTAPRLTVPEVVRLFVACLEALDACHRRGVVHRDLKPENVLLDGGGRPKLTDFGIARTAGDADRVTATGEVVGTPRYIAPEQIAGEPPGPSADLYAIGVMLFEALAGQPPFTAPGVYELVRQHAEDAPPRLEEVAPGVPGALALLTARALAKRPAARPRSADEFARLLAGTLPRRRRGPAVSLALAAALALIALRPHEQPPTPAGSAAATKLIPGLLRPAPAAPAGRSADELHRQVAERVRRGDWATAEKIAREGRRRFPDYPLFDDDLAAVYASTNRLAASEELLRDLLGLSYVRLPKPETPGPNRVRARRYYNLGLAVQRQGRVVEAEPLYRHAISDDPRMPEAHQNLGTVLDAEQRLGEAAAEYRAALALEPRLKQARVGLARLADRGVR